MYILAYHPMHIRLIEYSHHWHSYLIVIPRIEPVVYIGPAYHYWHSNVTYGPIIMLRKGCIISLYFGIVCGILLVLGQYSFALW
jgi:hypothetical protein